MGETALDPRSAHVAAFVAARAAGDGDAMADAALALAALQRFGPHAGRVPALLHEAYEAAAANRRTRARLAAALARSWVYGNDADRARPFAAEAVAVAEELGEAALLADALDAQLAASWGPDELPDRLHATTRLQNVAAHIDDPDARLRAHLWRLTTALESLDVVGVQRQLSALDLLADETDLPVMRFFAASRRAGYALMTGDIAQADALLDVIREAGAAAAAPDLYAIERVIAGERARQLHDVDALTSEAEIYEDYGAAQGIASISAEAAALWLESGDEQRAARLAEQVVGAGLHLVPRDVDWLLTLAKVVEVAARCGLVDIARDGAALLTPYAGRAVVNAGGVNFHGVVEDYLQQAAAVTGADGRSELSAAAAAAYRRLGATWWLRRLSGDVAVIPTPRTQPDEVQFHPLPDQRVWVIGRANAQVNVADMKGLHYLRLLLARPGVDVPAPELAAVVAGHAPVPESDAGERVDRQALDAYRRRLRDVDEELAEAGSWSDRGRVERLESERSALLEEVNAATGLGGRVRRSGSQDERARVAVRKAIAAVLDRLDQLEPTTARRLRRTVRTGAVCRYDPDPDDPVEWRLR